MNRENCDELKLNPSVSPLTNRKIKINGPTHKKLENDCKQFSMSQNSSNSQEKCEHWLKSEYPDLYELYEATTKMPTSTKMPIFPILGVNDFSVNYRLSEAFKIKKYFAALNLEIGKVCLQNKTLLRHLANISIFQKYDDYKIYKAEIPGEKNLKISVNQFPISRSEQMYEVALQRGQKKDEKKRSDLFKIFKFINDIVEDKVCPNFQLSYVDYFCNVCNESFEKNIKAFPCYVKIREDFNYTVSTLINFEDKVIMSLLFQLYYGIAALHHNGIYNEDLDIGQILIKETTPGNYWIYKLNDVDYYVPNLGYVALYHNFTNNLYYSKRIIDREREIDSESERDYLIYNKNNKIYVHHLGDLDGEQKIDLKNFEKFPVDYFAKDLLRISSYFYNNSKMSSTIKHLLRDHTKVFLPGRYPYKINESAPYLISATETIKKLFPMYLKKGVGFAIDQFSINYKI